ncbi:MAG: N-acetylmuramoyl-L-alanine amidase [Bacillus sp. (in: firmicutes)]
MKIALDAGHGYNTAGKRSPDGLREYVINRAIVEYMNEKFLKYNNVSVYYVHSDKQDVPLHTRTSKANSLKTDCYISIHANAFGDGKQWTSANGIETFVHPRAGKTTQSLAERTQRNLVISTGRKDRGVKTANFHVLEKTIMPAILVECGFMTHKEECQLLHTGSYQKACAEAIVKAVVEQFNLKAKQPKRAENKMTGFYKVQTGAFRNKMNAEAQAAELKEQGYNPYIVYENGQ